MTENLRIAVRRFDPFDSAIQRQFEAYKEATGSEYELEFESLDLNPLVDTLFTQSGLKDGTWDIAFMVTDWLADAVAHGSLLDLAPLLAEKPIADYPSGWPASLTRFQQFDNAIYGLPYHDGPECLIYRTDLFEDQSEQDTFGELYGRRLEIPRTWDEFEQIARFFTRPEKGQYGTLFAGFPDGHNTMYDFCVQLWSRGGDLTNNEGRPTIATPQAIAGLEFYRRLMRDRTVTPPGLEEVDSVQSGELFAQGSIAMMVNWFGFAAFCEQPESMVRGNVAVAPIPSTEDSSGASLSVYWVLSVAAGSHHKDEAFDFLRFCMSPEMDKVTTLEGGIGCRLSTWNDPEVNVDIPYYHQLAEIHEHARELPRAIDLPKLVHIVDAAVQEALATEEPTASILSRAQLAADDLRL